MAILVIAMTPMMLPVTNAGTLIIKVTDAPVDLKHLNMTIDSFEVRNKTDGWITVPIEGGRVSFDLLQLAFAARDYPLCWSRQVEPA